MRVGLLTREYPPDIYGGAGAHVEHLAHELRRRVDLQVHCWGGPRLTPGVVAHQPWTALTHPEPEVKALQAMSIDLAMVAGTSQLDLVHSHTWYTNLAGHWAKLAWDLPHVVTSHSLEPLRPWKQEQLGGGYQLSCFCERTGLLGADAVIAVSSAMRRDILACYPEIDPERVRVIYNGVDPDIYHPRHDPSVARRLGFDPESPYALFVGRITRQKGLSHLLNAAEEIDPAYTMVIVAGEPDTPGLEVEIASLVDKVQKGRGNLIWQPELMPREELAALLTGATAFVCPSIYEPFGLVNIEAMACATAVVASRVGGIPEVVVDQKTGYLVDWDPARPQQFEHDLAERVNQLLADPAQAAAMGEAGRRRVMEQFIWPVIADQTVALYEELGAVAPTESARYESQ
jgi:alpha-maltose-1-phosphate synthase